MQEKRVLFIGSYFQDIFYLLVLADELVKNGYKPYFIVANPLEKLRASAIVEIEKKNYPYEELIETAWSNRSMFSQVFKVVGEQKEFSAKLLKRLSPSLIITTKNLFNGKFYEVANEMKIPSIFYQWTLMHSQKNNRRIKSFEDKFTRGKLSLYVKLKTQLRRAILSKVSGISELWPLSAPYTNLFMISNIFKKNAIDSGIEESKILITGNVQCDEMYYGRFMTAEEVVEFKKSIGLSADEKYIIHTREDYGRLLRLTDEDRVNAQRTILLAMKEAAPGYKRVVKIHPKESQVHIDKIREIDPEAIIMDSTYSLPKAIKSSNLVISSMSTTLANAVGLDVPAISSFLWDFLTEYKDSRFYVGIDYADSFELLKQKIHDNLFDEEYILKTNEKRKKGCEDMLMADGKSMERMVNFINQILA